MKRFDVLPKHLEGIVAQLRVTKDVEAAIFLYENEDGSFKVSTRSSGNVDVSKIAVKYGGGGHARAAGITMNGSADEIIKTMVAEVANQLEQ